MQTWRRAQTSIAVILVSLAALAAAGCGSSSSSSSSTAASTTSTSTTSQGASNEGTGAKEFFQRGAENIVVKIGHEGTTSEREEVNKLLEESYKAREALDWAGQCATLSAAAVKKVEENATTKGKKGCTANLKPIGEAAPEAVLENNMADPVGAFRVNGAKGFALYHGTDEIDWIMPMEKENGEWKVGALSAELVPGSE